MIPFAAAQKWRILIDLVFSLLEGGKEMLKSKRDIWVMRFSFSN